MGGWSVVSFLPRVGVRLLPFSSPAAAEKSSIFVSDEISSRTGSEAG
jgi:hypothetical protein